MNSEAISKNQEQAFSAWFLILLIQEGISDKEI